MKGLLPARLARSSIRHLRQTPASDFSAEARLPVSTLHSASPMSKAPSPSFQQPDEEATLYLPPSQLGLAHSPSMSSLQLPSSPNSHQGAALRGAMCRLRPHDHTPLKRRPAAVRVIVPDGYREHERPPSLIQASLGERTPLIKTGVNPDQRKSSADEASTKLLRRAEVGLGRMVELGLPLIM